MGKKKRKAPARERIYNEGALRIEMTSRSFIAHVKMPIGMSSSDIEDLLDDELDNATEIIIKKREEMNV